MDHPFRRPAPGPADGTGDGTGAHDSSLPRPVVGGRLLSAPLPVTLAGVKGPWRPPTGPSEPSWRGDDHAAPDDERHGAERRSWEARDGLVASPSVVGTSSPGTHGARGRGLAGVRQPTRRVAGPVDRR